MALRNFFVLLTILLVSASCGKSATNNSTPVFLSKQITNGMPAPYLKKNELISSLKRHQLILDTDGDGILDKDDADIDNDGVPNDCDLAPFDKTIGTADADKDGIPDFCDLNPRSDKIADNGKAAFQKKIFKQYGFLLVEDDLKFSEKDVPFMEELLNKISEKAVMPSKKLFTMALTTNMALGEYGSYDSNWANIRYTQDNIFSDNIPELKMWQWALTHEFFHFVAAAALDYFEEFHERYLEEKKNKTLTYPTEYSKESEAEYFAEYETSLYFNL